MTDGPETTLTRKIRKAVLAEHPDAWIFKVHGSPVQTAGVPDLLICVDGLLVAAEVKVRKPGESWSHVIGRVTPRQWAQLDKLVAAGAVALVVTEPEHVLTAISEARVS